MNKSANFYYVDDVQRILDMGHMAAYKVIKKLNSELEAKGYLTCKGRVSKNYLKERYNIG